VKRSIYGYGLALAVSVGAVQALTPAFWRWADAREKRQAWEAGADARAAAAAWEALPASEKRAQALSIKLDALANYGADERDRAATLTERRRAAADELWHRNYGHVDEAELEGEVEEMLARPLGEFEKRTDLWTAAGRRAAAIASAAGES